MQGHYGQLLDEWIYSQIPLGLLVEPFIGASETFPIDYKIFVFGGRAVCVKVDRDRELGHWRAIYDLNWAPIWVPKGWPQTDPPPSLSRMIEAAEALAADFDFARVDFYDVDGKPRFGEITFYPGSGLSPLPRSLDLWLGSKWTAARSKVPAYAAVQPALVADLIAS